MRIFLMPVLLIFFLTSTSAQTEKASYRTVADRFELLYNNDSYDSIFSLFADVMKKALPPDQTTDFLTGLKSEAGKIIKKQFIDYVNGSYATYKTNFERAIFAVNISIDDDAKINGLFVKPFTEDALPKMERNITKLKLPFTGAWTVFWGGDTKELNYHVESRAQKNAFDIMITDAAGKTHKGAGELNEDYYAFGREITAPCDGIIVLAVDGIKDNKPGVFNPVYIPGNSVIIKTARNEYLFFAHFKNHSIVIKEGQKIKQGMLLGLCGNTGNSSEPHLHFHIQNVEDMNVATGVKCYFEQIMVNGKVMQDYSPVKGDKVENGE